MSIKLSNSQNEALDVSFLGFSGGERHVQLGEFEKTQQFVIRALLRTSDDIFDLLLLADALNAKFNAPQLFIEIPYLPYARQDRVCAPGQAFSLKVISALLGQIENVSKLVVWDCHSPVGLELTGAYNVPAEDIIQTDQAFTDLINAQDSVLICPDKGAINRTQKIAETLGKHSPLPVVYCEKVRDPATGNILRTDVKSDDLAGKTALITDDICDGGYTFIKIAEILREKNVERVVLFVTHGIFSKGLAVFDGLLDEIFTTQSFMHEDNPRLTVIPYAFRFKTK